MVYWLSKTVWLIVTVSIWNCYRISLDEVSRTKFPVKIDFGRAVLVRDGFDATCPEPSVRLCTSIVRDRGWKPALVFQYVRQHTNSIWLAHCSAHPYFHHILLMNFDFNMTLTFPHHVTYRNWSGVKICVTNVVRAHAQTRVWWRHLLLSISK